ncbi:MAG: ATP synthase F1 subunit delta [Acidimicrobiia bacterium]|nr:ATP synthase F1 subunit delta [Acidimicrobiia bacterium]
MAERTAGYASAIYELARAEGDLARVEGELATIARAIDESADLRSSLTDPALPLDRKRAIIDDLIGGRASRTTGVVISMVTGLNRMGELGEIAKRLSERSAASVGKKLAEVRSAFQLDEATVQRLAAALEKQTGTPVEVRTVIDPSIVGGIVTRVGDTVIDGSVRSQLESLRQSLRNQ